MWMSKNGILNVDVKQKKQNPRFNVEAKQNKIRVLMWMSKNKKCWSLMWMSKNKIRVLMWVSKNKIRVLMWMSKNKIRVFMWMSKKNKKYEKV